MSVTFRLEANVTYADVDRREVMLLPRLFKLLQEAAIAHANLFGAGTNAVSTRGESWVLNRIEVEVARYPAAGEAVVVETWSTGIKGFKGYRDFRIFDAQHRPIVFGSSLWLYVSVATKGIIRVPRELAATFPMGSEPAWHGDLEGRRLDSLPTNAEVIPVTLRYSDFDVNEHVNNTAYLDLVQTALATARRNVHPRRIQVQYAKAIPITTESVDVRIGGEASRSRFSIEHGGVVFAGGVVED